MKYQIKTMRFFCLIVAFQGLIAGAMCNDNNATNKAMNEAFAHYESDDEYVPVRRTEESETDENIELFFAEIQGMMCPDRCDGIFFSKNVEAISDCYNCFPCDCNSQCATHGTCCPQLDDDWSPPPAERALCRHESRLKVSILHVTTCDPDFSSNSTTRSLCESESVPQRRDTVFPVMSAVTNVTYANVHCAACNFDGQNVSEWEITCVHNQFMYEILNDTEYDERAIQSPEICIFVMKPFMAKVKYHVCEERFYSDQAISACNVTGRWVEMDEGVRNACERSTWSRGAVVSVGKVTMYANVFCAICNGEQGIIDGQCQSTSEFAAPINGDYYRTLTGFLSWTIKVEDIQNSLDVGCPMGYWRHPQGECRMLQCTAGKLLTYPKICTTAVDRVRGLGYRLRMLLRPVRLLQIDTDPRSTASVPPGSTSTTSSPPIPTASTKDAYNASGAPVYVTYTIPQPLCSYNSLVWKTLKEKVILISDKMQANITAVSTAHGICFFDAFGSQLDKLTRRPSDVGDGAKQQERNIDGDMLGKTSFLTAEIEADVIASHEITRDLFEVSVLSEIFNQEWNISFDRWTVMLRAVDLTSELQGNGEQSAFAASVGDEGETEKFHFVRGWRNEDPLSGLEHLFLPLSDRLVCSFLQFEGDEFEVRVTDSKAEIYFPFYLDSYRRPITFDANVRSNGSWVEDYEKRLTMCLSTYEEVFPKNVTIIKPGPGVSLVRQLMSVVCGSISVVCLAITFFTYSLFSQLRSLPGLNNMGLSLSLGAAQLFVLIPWHRTNVPGVCRAVGLLTHWQWTMALTWMLVCCLHMVRVFVSRTRHALSPRETKRAFLCNVCGTVLVSTGVVLITIIVSSAISGGSNIGYGGYNCFLDTGLHQLLVLAFLLPLGLTVIINLICFGFTVCSIIRVRRLQAHAPRERRDILVYAKLVTLTGGAWALSLFSELADKEWMRVVAELCTAAQGLLIFCSYVCNTRIWRLYCARLRRPGPTSPTANTVSTDVSHTNRPKSSK